VTAIVTFSSTPAWPLKSATLVGVGDGAVETILVDEAIATSFPPHLAARLGAADSIVTRNFESSRRDGRRVIDTTRFVVIGEGQPKS
jgi:hypothetical protein